MKTFNYLNYDLTLRLMSVPTVYRLEHMMIDFIKSFAIENNIDYYQDNYGNLYLTKGLSCTYYPCLTAHMDTVQMHEPYIINNKPLDVSVIEKDGKTIMLSSNDKIGLGCDDKCGIAVALSILEKTDCLKCAFFVQEELGCFGSVHLDKDFFLNVGYVIGLDSPEMNRAAHTCSNVQLFSADFHKKHLSETCKAWGLDKFYSEPYTDVMNIKKNFNVQCMNFGVGYYKMHSSDEYCVVEEMDNVCGMCMDLIESLGNNLYEFKGSDNLIIEEKKKEALYLSNLGDVQRINERNKKKFSLNEVLDFLYSREDEIKNNIKSKCVEYGIDFSIFKDCF